MGFDLDAVLRSGNDTIHWPYDGPRLVTSVRPVLEIRSADINGKPSRFFDQYDGEGSRVDFDAKADSYDNLPVGHEAFWHVNLTLNMEVDDPSIPQPDYPETFQLGNTRSIEIDEANGRFRFLGKKGPQGPAGNSNFAKYLRRMIEFYGWSPANPPTDPDFWWYLSDLNMDGVVFDAVTEGEGKFSKTHAFPVSPNGPEGPDDNPFDQAIREAVDVPSLTDLANASSNSMEFMAKAVAIKHPAMGEISRDREQVYQDSRTV